MLDDPKPVAQKRTFKEAFRPSELANKFSSKADLINYCKEHRKSFQLFLTDSLYSSISGSTFLECQQRLLEGSACRPKEAAQGQRGTLHQHAQVWRALRQEHLSPLQKWPLGHAVPAGWVPKGSIPRSPVLLYHPQHCACWLCQLDDRACQRGTVLGLGRGCVECESDRERRVVGRSQQAPVFQS